LLECVVSSAVVKPVRGLAICIKQIFSWRLHFFTYSHGQSMQRTVTQHRSQSALAAPSSSRNQFHFPHDIEL
jgi:hypothetical protein